MIVYRIMKKEDIAAGLMLCRVSRWNQVQRDWEFFLASGSGNCMVAVKDEKVAGTVATISYQHVFSWIGMVLVDPANQKQGIGRRLLEEALNILKDEETIKLDATPQGREVYLKLSFIDEYRLSRMEAVNLNKIVLTNCLIDNSLEGRKARPLLKTDLSAVNELDKAVFGADRGSLLEWLWEGAQDYAFVVEDDNGICGFCMARHGHNFTHIGPLVTEDQGHAKLLLSAALAHHSGKPLITDILHHTPEWLEWLGQTGFTEQRPFIRMYKGNNRFPGIPSKQFAIAGPEFG